MMSKFKSTGAWILLCFVCICLGCSTRLAKKVNESAVANFVKSGKTNKVPDVEHKAFRPDLAVMPYANFDDEQVTIRHVRNCRYRSESDYDVRFYDMTFALADVRSVDFIIVPFKESSLLAHTMLSFGLADGRHFAISVEARLGVNENYSTVGGAGRRFPLMYVIGDERDLILLRTSIRDVEVFLYKGKATPDQAQDLLVDMLMRANKLQQSPEYYDTLTNNCTTNLVNHVNKLRPGRIPFDLRVLLPGHSDRLAYELGLLEIEGPFEYARQYAHINALAEANAESPEFSSKIRRQ